MSGAQFISIHRVTACGTVPSELAMSEQSLWRIVSLHGFVGPRDCGGKNARYQSGKENLFINSLFPACIYQTARKNNT